MDYNKYHLHQQIIDPLIGNLIELKSKIKNRIIFLKSHSQCPNIYLT